MPRPPTPAQLATLVIAAVTAIYLVLAGLILNPRTFYNGDAGVKYVQVQNLVHSGWRHLAVRNPAPRFDPQGEFSVLATNQFKRRSADDPFYGQYSELFTVPASLGLGAFGLRGMYLVPILASLGTMIVAYRLSSRTAPRTAWLAPGLVGACSPLLFYSVDLWEHTLATLLVTGSLLLLLRGTGPFTARRYALAGLLLGAAIAVREELYAMLPATLVSLTWIERRWRLRAALAAAAGGFIALSSHWALKWAEFGRPARNPVLRIAGIEPAPSAAATGLDALALLVPTAAVWWVPLVAMVIARWWLPRAAPRRRPVLLAALAVATVLWASAAALVLRLTWEPPLDLLRAFPVILFLLFLPPRQPQPSAAQREIRQLLMIAAVFVAGVCVAAPFSLGAPIGGSQWGPRFLLPACVLLAAAVVYALERRDEWASVAAAPRRLLPAVFAVLTLAGLAVQLQGVRNLHAAKQWYERVVTATEAISDHDVIVTDIWWYPAVTASVLYQHEMLSVARSGNDALPGLLARLQQRGATSLTLVTAGDGPSPGDADALAQAGWTETGRRVVPIWLDVRFVSYRRDASADITARARPQP
jgi:hypothetical protein